jgi:hypothetical protein
MATRDKRLAEFNGEGQPPPDQPVQVLCEDHSGTYQLPFACRFIDGAWRNHDSGGPVGQPWSAGGCGVPDLRAISFRAVP